MPTMLTAAVSKETETLFMVYKTIRKQLEAQALGNLECNWSKTCHKQERATEKLSNKILVQTARDSLYTVP